MKKRGKKLLSYLLALVLVLGLMPWISLPAEAATSNAAKEVAVNEPSLPENVKRAKDGTLTYSEDGLGMGNFDEEAIEGGTVFRLYNPNSGEHFYTLSVFERDSVVKAGWTDEGVAYDASVKASDSDAVPVYRVYNPNAPADNSSHHYTCNAAEAQNLVSLGWRFEGVGFYVFQADRKNGMTVYREYNPNNGAHNYTTDKAEHNFLMEVGWADENTAWKVKDVREVGTQKEMEAALATTSLTDLKIATNKKVELSIPEEDYALVDLIVDAPKATITNAGAFRSIDLRSIAANTWTEKGKNNIVVNNNSPVHIVIDTLNNILSSLKFNGKIDGVNILKVISGALKELSVTNKDPIDVSVSGEAQLASVAVDAATNVIVSGKDNAGIGTARVNTPGARFVLLLSDDSTLDTIIVPESASSTADEKTNVKVYTEDGAAVGDIEVGAAGADVSVSASGKSTVGKVTVPGSASSPDTTVEVKAEDSAEISSVTTSANDANVSVTSNGQSKVGTVKVEGAALATVDGNSSNKTTVDITGAVTGAKLVVKTGAVEIKTTPNTDTSSIVDNQSGSSIPTKSTNSDNNEQSGSIPPKDSDPGSGGGSSEGGSGGSSGGGYTPSPDTSVKVSEVSIDNPNPKVGDKISATAYPTTASNVSSYTTYQWYISENGKEYWEAIQDADESAYTVTATDENMFLKCEMGGEGVKTVSGVTTKAVVQSYEINFTAAPTGGTVAVKVGNKDITTNGLAAANDTISITATPTDGYTLTALTATGEGGLTLDPAGVAAAGGTYTFTMPAHNVTVEATFAEKEVANIAVKTAPDKLTYGVGDFFDPTGLVLNVTYEGDTSPVEVAYEGNEAKFEFTPATSTALSLGNNAVTIKYGDKTIDQTITVKAASDLELTSEASVTLDIEGTSDIEATATNDLSYESSNTGVATVDASGKITAVAAGKATITITAAESNEMAEGTATVSVAVRAASDLALTSQATLTLGVGAKSQISTASLYLPTYESSDKNVATVDEYGEITAVAAGTATITITAAESDRMSEGTAEVTVTVVDIIVGQGYNIPNDQDLTIHLDQTNASDSLPNYAVSDVKVDNTDNNSITIGESDGTLTIPASIFKGKDAGDSVVITLTLGYKKNDSTTASKKVKITVIVEGGGI